MSRTIEQILGLKPPAPKAMRFSFLFFSDVRTDVTDSEKYQFMTEVTRFADQSGFEAIYLPERHFYEFGSIYANPAIMAANLIPQTSRIRFRTAGITLPLHHPAEVVEWWAMNDVLSRGRVDLGFGSGWATGDFVLAPQNYENRRSICSDGIETVRRLWRGEAVAFPGPAGQDIPISVFPRPLQPELNVWLLVTNNDEGFIHAGRQNYNIFTMLYGNNLDVMSRKIALYRNARREAGLDPAAGTVTMTMHTLLLDDRARVGRAVEAPLKDYIRSSLNAHVTAAATEKGVAAPSEEQRAAMLEYAYQRYYKTCAIFGTVEDGRAMVDQALAAGVDEIACLVDFGVDYGVVRESLANLERLVGFYAPAGSTSSRAK
jgi:natural product biosynthesis luciferase-like monooxygenase protein